MRTSCPSPKPLMSMHLGEFKQPAPKFKREGPGATGLGCVPWKVMAVLVVSRVTVFGLCSLAPNVGEPL